MGKGEKKSPCLGSGCKLDFGTFLDHAPISECEGKQPPNVGKEGGGEGRELGCAVALLSGRIGPIYLLVPGRERQASCWGVFILCGVNTIAAQWGMEEEPQKNSSPPEQLWI